MSEPDPTPPQDAPKPPKVKVPCPHCGHEIRTRVARLGKFHPNCPSCGRRFDLTLRAKQDGSIDARADVGLEDGDDALGTVLGLSSDTIAPGSVSRKPKPAKAKHKVKRKRPTPQPVADPGGSAAGVTVAPSRPKPTPQIADVAADVTAAPRREPAPAPASVPAHEPPRKLGGYELRQKLGEGGMGSVYLARQVSLDRDVALKLLAGDLAGDAEFVARFTREAYAAAQLTHHNVVQIYDIGREDAAGDASAEHFFSMEFVRGATLAGVLAERGKVPPAEAVALTLQAARGLSFAHEMGLVHRDVKPENLLIDPRGVVKVADLGLAKQVGEAEALRRGKLSEAADASVTDARVAMGTPAYMPPEQCADAAGVDARADVYALGCSLYHLLTGRPPFEGATAAEVMTKHQTEPMVPPDRVADDVPGSLGRVVARMTAKEPADRYPTMAACVAALEGWLGESEDKPETPSTDSKQRLALAVRQYHEPPLAKARPWLVRGFFAACALAAAVTPFAPGGWLGAKLSGLAVGVAVLTVVTHIVLAGVRRQTHLWQRLKALVVEASVLDWLLWLVGGALMLLVLWSMGLLAWWVGAAVLAAGVAAAFHFGVDEVLERQRATPLAHIGTLLRKLRVAGFDENAIRHFMATESGDDWEETYEREFGYAEKLDARRAFHAKAGTRPKPRHAAWREPLLRFIDARLAAKKLRREERLLTEAEKGALRAKGLGDEVAGKQAKAAAIRYLSAVQGFRREADTLVAPRKPQRPEPAAEVEAPAEAPAPAGGGVEEAIRRKEQAYTDDEFVRVRESWFARRFGSPVDVLLGPATRLLLGVLLLPVLAFWLNTATVSAEGDASLTDTMRDVTVTETDATAGGSRRARTAEELEAAASVSVDNLSPNIAEQLRQYDLYNATLGLVVPDGLLFYLSSWTVGVAALILISSVIYNRRLFAALTLLSVALVIFLRGGTVPGVEYTIDWWLAAAIGGGLYVVGWFFFRTDEGY